MSSKERWLAVLMGVAAFSMVHATWSYGADQIEARANAGRGNTVEVEAPKAILSDGDGVSIAGAKVFNPAKEDYQVSGAAGSRAANAVEKAAMQGLIPVVQALSAAANDRSGTDAQQRARVAAASAAYKAAAAGLAPNGANFAELPKGPGVTLRAETKLLENTNAFEQAKAIAQQTVLGTPPVVSTRGTDAGATVRPGLAPNPMAASFAINRDPLALSWPSLVSEITLTFDNILLANRAVGPGSAAAAAYDLAGSYVNGTLDLGVPRESATDLFSVSLGVFGSGGDPTLLLSEFNSFGNPIRDSVGNTTAATVGAEFMSRFGALGDDMFGFSSGYSITIGIPGMPSQSVVFVDEYLAASAQSVPEPSTLAMVGTASLVWIISTRLGRRKSTFS